MLSLRGSRERLSPFPATTLTNLHGTHEDISPDLPSHGSAPDSTMSWDLGLLVAVLGLLISTVEVLSLRAAYIASLQHNVELLGENGKRRL